MSGSYSQSSTATLRRALYKRVADAWVDQATVDEQWQTLGFTARPDLDAAAREQEQFFGVLRENGVSIELLPRDGRTTIDSIYAMDPVVMTHAGAVVLNMGKHARRPEALALEDRLRALGVPVLGRIEAPGTLEGGDTVWVDERTLAVGLSYRTNREGLRQMAALLAGIGAQVLEVQMPHWRGERELLHLMSAVSPLAGDLWLVKRDLLPACFVQEAAARGIEMVDVDDAEFDAGMASNVLAVAPRRVVMIEGNPRTKAAMERHGCTVFTFPGKELCHKGCGGPTCMTQPLVRL
eukprot:m51a1_g7655 putative amidinotransferase (294) ;mRNA; r:399344-400416